MWCKLFRKRQASGPRFLVDANLPLLLAHQLTKRGYDTVHALEMPGEQPLPDEVLRSKALWENRIVITRDHDFVESHIQRHNPERVLLVSDLQASKKELVEGFINELPRLIQLIKHHELLVWDGKGLQVP